MRAFAPRREHFGHTARTELGFDVVAAEHCAWDDRAPVTCA
jgi:hypothetical protein